MADFPSALVMTAAAMSIAAATQAQDLVIVLDNEIKSGRVSEKDMPAYVAGIRADMARYNKATEGWSEQKRNDVFKERINAVQDITPEQRADLIALGLNSSLSEKEVYASYDKIMSNEISFDDAVAKYGTQSVAPDIAASTNEANEPEVKSPDLPSRADIMLPVTGSNIKMTKGKYKKKNLIGVEKNSVVNISDFKIGEKTLEGPSGTVLNLVLKDQRDGNQTIVFLDIKGESLATVSFNNARTSKYWEIEQKDRVQNANPGKVFTDIVREGVEVAGNRKTDGKAAEVLVNSAGEQVGQWIGNLSKRNSSTEQSEVSVGADFDGASVTRDGKPLRAIDTQYYKQLFGKEFGIPTIDNRQGSIDNSSLIEKTMDVKSSFIAAQFKDSLQFNIDSVVETVAVEAAKETKWADKEAKRAESRASKDYFNGLG